MTSWAEVLRNYSYPVNLSEYRRRECFPGYFLRTIKGDASSTIEFENYFRNSAHTAIEVYFEVIFWKLYSRIARTGNYDALDYIVRRMQEIGATPAYLLSKIATFAKDPSLQNLQSLRSSMGLTKENGPLAVALTFPAFYDPMNFPMIDINVAQWVNTNLLEHNTNRKAKLSRFENANEPLRDENFPNYLNWTYWCRESATILSSKSCTWRARDVEMAVFAANQQGTVLDVSF